MNHFFKTHAILVIGLFVLVSGTNATLERLAAAPDRSSVHWYDGQGKLRFAYDGDLANCPADAPVSVVLLKRAAWVAPVLPGLF